MKRHLLFWICAAAGACAADDGVTHNRFGVAVVDHYDRTFIFAQPMPCKIFLRQRVTDEDARTVEYDGDDFALLYSIAANRPYPLVAQAFRGGIGAAKLAVQIEANDHDLRVLGPDGDVRIVVHDYAGDAAATGIELSGPPNLDLAAIAHLACALPARTELGPVPQFLLNRSTGGRDPMNPDVSHQSTSPQPILDWKGTVTLIGAYVLGGVCLRESNWACPCLNDFATDVSGSLRGWCSSPFPKPAGRQQ